MTEQEWLECADPGPMLEFLRGKTSDRKLRLFACAGPSLLSRRLGDIERIIINIGECYADNKATHDQLKHGRYLARHKAKFRGLWLTVVENISGALLPVFTHEYYLWFKRVERYCPIICDIFGNPFQRTTINLAWLTPTVNALAQSVYEKRSLPSGILDNARLNILADSLKDAGCNDSDILTHLRQSGDHYRGCWAVDLLLGKE